MVLLTHMHADHTGGLVVDERRHYPNAQLVVNRAEYTFFSDPDELPRAPERLKPSHRVAQKVAELYTDVQLIEGDEQVMPGLRAVAAYGHTPGHTVYLLENADQRMLFLGDAVFSPDFSFQYLDYTLAFDGDIPTARKVRRRLLTLAAEERLLVAGTHLPFPSFGYVRFAGPAFEFVPLRMFP